VRRTLFHEARILQHVLDASVKRKARWHGEQALSRLRPAKKASNPFQDLQVVQKDKLVTTLHCINGILARSKTSGPLYMVQVRTGTFECG
jgi:hypothetical protein